jgi:6-phosphogluconolactonase
MQSNCHWHYLAAAEHVAEYACQRITEIAEQAIKERGQFKLVLAGGTTPEKIYGLLAEAQADWLHWHIYFGDERCLPKTHPDRNSLMAERIFLSKVPIPVQQIFVMPAELPPEQAALSYQPIVAGALPFDLVLLGVGEDGHTASLFPGHRHNEDEWVHPVFNSPKPPPERITMSARALSQARHVMMIITGKNKQDAVRNWISGESLPIAAIKPESPIEIVMDQAARPE